MTTKHESYDPNPENTPEKVKELVEARIDRKPDEAMPELLSEFCTLLGHEKEKWGGVAAMKVCIEELKKGRQDSKNHQKDSEECQNPKDDQIPTVKDLETFLFSPNRYIPIVIPGSDSPSTCQADTLGAVSQISVPPLNPKTLKGSDSTPNTSHPVIPGAVSQTSVPPANPKTLKGSDSTPNTSQPVIPGAVSQTAVPPANPKTLKGSDSTPNTSQPVIQGAVSQTSGPPANPKTLKVKIYMGSGWKIDFPKLAPPSLLVKINVEGDKSQENYKSQKNDKSQKKDKSKKTKVQKKTWTPCWGEEFEFSLSTLADAKLSLEVHNDKTTNGFAGKACVSVSELKSGIRVIALSDSAGKPYNSTWLLMRFML